MVIHSYYFFFFKQKTAYDMRISDWSSDVCSSDLQQGEVALEVGADLVAEVVGRDQIAVRAEVGFDRPVVVAVHLVGGGGGVQSHEIGRASCRARVCQYV